MTTICSGEKKKKIRVDALKMHNTATIGIRQEKKDKSLKEKEKRPSPGGLEPPTFRLTAERANRLRHGDLAAQCRKF